MKGIKNIAWERADKIKATVMEDYVLKLEHFLP